MKYLLQKHNNKKMFEKAVPILPANNISDTIEFYTCKLGFTGLSFGNYGIVKYKNAEIHIFLADSKKKFEYASCYIFVDNVEDLYADLSAKELIYPKGQLLNKHWGCKEFSITDNNGNVIRLGQKK